MAGTTNSLSMIPRSVQQRFGIRENKPPMVKKAKAAKLHGADKVKPALDDEYCAVLVCGIELVFTDYAFQQPESKAWLEQHYRKVDGEQNYIHLSSLLDNANISTIKPAPTTKAMQYALQNSDSTYVELKNDYFVRRIPKTFPAKHIPADSFSIVDDNGVAYWDQRSIYVEPSERGYGLIPARVAWTLKWHAQMHVKWLPIQACFSNNKAYAWAVLSGKPIQKQWDQWLKLELPTDWIVMSKEENIKRAKEYIALKEMEEVEKAAITGSKRKRDTSISTLDKSRKKQRDETNGPSGNAQVVVLEELPKVKSQGNKTLFDN